MVESLGDGVGNVIEDCGGGVEGFEAMLMGVVWNFCCDVWKQGFFQDFGNGGEE